MASNWLRKSSFGSNLNLFSAGLLIPKLTLSAIRAANFVVVPLEAVEAVDEATEEHEDSDAVLTALSESLPEEELDVSPHEVASRLAAGGDWAPPF